MFQAEQWRKGNLKCSIVVVAIVTNIESVCQLRVATVLDSVTKVCGWKAVLCAHLAPFFLRYGMLLESGLDPAPSTAPPGAHRPDLILAKTQNFGLLSYWCFRKPTLSHYHCCCPTCLPQVPQAPALPTRVSTRKGNLQAEKSAQVCWVFMLTSTTDQPTAKVKGAGKEVLLWYLLFLLLL